MAVATRTRQPLLGRDIEIETLQHLLADARSGHSSMAVVEGEAGVGKSAILDCLEELADGMQIARAAGVEPEMDIPYSGLHQLLLPFLNGLKRIPGPHRDALQSAFGLQQGSPANRFFIGMAALALLSDAALKSPVLCMVDDAHRIDPASLDALGFAARRMVADRVAMILAVREQDPPIAALQDLPLLELDGLSEGAALQLLKARVGGELDGVVARRIVAETRGNPLALTELARELSPEQLAGSEPIPEPMPLGARLEDLYMTRIRALPGHLQTLLLLAAADPSGDPALISRAADELGIGETIGLAPEISGFLYFAPAFGFHHPLMRSAAYYGASAQERRRAHQALADASEPTADSDRRAWHLAAATMGVDDNVAAELERSAGRAQVRGGPAAAAAFLERSAVLTADPPLRAARLLQAAGAHLTAGANHRAHELLAPSVRDLVDPMARAQAMRMDGVIRFFDGRGGDTPSLLFDAAMVLRDFDVALARETLMEAFETAMWAGELTSGTTTLDVAEAACAMPAPEPDESPASLLLAGYGERLTTGYAAALEPWRRAADANSEAVRREPHIQWQGMFWNMTGDRFEFERHVSVARQRVRIGRKLGALSDLPIALSCLGWNELQSGRLDIAEAMVAEAVEIAAATGNPSMPGAQELMSVATLAWRGHEEEARSYVQRASA